ncbi:MAG: HupE/UreJ family protein [Arenicellales bacterium]
MYWILTMMALVSSPINAHEIRPAIIDIEVAQNGGFKGSIKLNLEAMLADIGSEHDNTDDSKNADRYQQLRASTPQSIETAFEQQAAIFTDNIIIQQQDTRVPININGLDVPDIGEIDLARDSVILFSGQLNPTQPFSWRWEKALGDAVLRVNDHQQNELYTEYIIAGQSSEGVTLDTALERSVWSIFKNYVRIGFEHILPKGADHILFVVGIFLLSAHFSALLWQLTSFTLAHSVTLALGILGIISVPASIVEPLIALSIVYVCVENIALQRLSRWRPILVFCFGLIHGLGFASVLKDIGIADGHFVTGLIAFNIGVELGQIAVILACFLLVGRWFRNKPWYRPYITLPASFVIALIGAYWFIERTLL